MLRPNILVIAGHDPSGGAGIQADIESAAANGAHAATVISLLTCQDTHNVHAATPVATDFFARCLDTALADMTFAAIKIGVVGTVEQVDVIGTRLRALAQVPVVLDPVLRAAGGGSLADDAVGAALRDDLFRHANVITPNTSEARLLCDGEASIARCGERLSNQGCPTLITGGDDDDKHDVTNTLYRAGATVGSQRWPRLAGTFHGSGCTLASAIAARLACGESLETALLTAQAYTAQALERAFAAGRGQRIPARWLSAR